VPTVPLTVSQRRLLAVLAACALAVALVYRHHGAGSAPALKVAPLKVAPLSRAAPKQIVVDVAGAVARPGLYHLRQGARVADAIARAGGLTRHAERAAVNLAAPVADGQQVLVTARGAGGGSAASSGSATGPVSLSSATAEQLDALPGIGPVTAQKILSYRQQHGPFTSVEALDAIPGIGPARIADLQGLVVP
jgi:competence protein ComEA